MGCVFGGDVLEEVFVGHEAFFKTGGGFAEAFGKQELQGGAVGGKPLAACEADLAAGEDAVGDFQAAGEDFARQAALPCGVGVGGVEAGAVAQVGAGLALQPDGVFRLRLALGGEGFGALQHGAAAADEVVVAGVGVGERGLD